MSYRARKKRSYLRYRTRPARRASGTIRTGTGDWVGAGVGVSVNGTDVVVVAGIVVTAVVGMVV